MAKVSVIMPVYNAQETLKRCLDALCSQTYKDFEVICIDDGSKDSSLEILKTYSEKDPRIVVLSQKNSGPAMARNYAISKSTGEYLMFCDADDWYEPEMIEQMVTTLEEQNVDIVMCDSNIIDLSNRKVHNSADIAWHRLRLKGFVELDSKTKDILNSVIWNKIFRKDLIKKYDIKYPKKYEHDDTIFCWKYVFSSKTYYGIEKKLYNYVAGNPKSVSGKYKVKEITPNMFDFILSMEDLYKFMKKTESQNDYTEYMSHNFRTISRFYVLYLPKCAKKEAYKIIKEIVKKHIELLGKYSDKFQYIAKCDKFKDFDNFMLKSVVKSGEKVSFLENILSVKNEGCRKVLRLFGLKFKFKNAKLCQREEMKNILRAINEQSKITKELVKKTDELLIAVKEMENNN